MMKLVSRMPKIKASRGGRTENVFAKPVLVGVEEDRSRSRTYNQVLSISVEHLITPQQWHACTHNS